MLYAEMIIVILFVLFVAGVFLLTWCLISNSFVLPSNCFLSFPFLSFSLSEKCLLQQETTFGFMGT